VRDGAVTGFRTLMTGELFALLQQHSILGTGTTATTTNPEAFARGVVSARDSGAAGALSRLFSARTLMLDDSLAPDAVADYLSGLLIGEELRSALAAGRIDHATPLRLIGKAPLCHRYAAAASCFELGMALPPPGAAALARGRSRAAPG
jgi:2-dehydro-3-deoxygalactonokinase